MKNKFLIMAGMSLFLMTCDHFHDPFLVEITEPGISASNIRITFDGAVSSVPSLVWGGGEYGVCWVDLRNGDAEIYFTRISAAGVKQGDDVRITNATGDSLYPSLVWTGTEYGVCWIDVRDNNPEIYFARISAAGVKQETDVRITDGTGKSLHPSLVWTGTEYGVCWNDDQLGDFEIYFCRISATGTPDPAVRITWFAGDSCLPSLAWTGTEYGVTWQENYEIYFARMGEAGDKLTADLQITDNPQTCNDPELVWTGTEYGVFWHDDRDGNNEIYGARLDAAGAKQAFEERITNATSSSLCPSPTWTGTGYGITWQDIRSGRYELYFTRLDSAGVKTLGDMIISDGANGSYQPSLVWTGTEYGVCWIDDRDGNAEIYFTRITY